MARKNRNAQRKFDTRITFKQLCHRAGISVRQRIIMTRTIKEVRIRE